MSLDRASLALIAGIAALAFPILGPFAWMYGSRTIRAIDGGERSKHRDHAIIGRRLARIGTGVLVAVLLMGLLLGSPDSMPNSMEGRG